MATTVSMLCGPSAQSHHLFAMQGKYAEADALYERSQAIREKVLGPEHPDLAQPLIMRAGLLGEQVRAVRFPGTICVVFMFAGR